MALSMLEKELVAVGISVAVGCRPCTTYHVGEARRAGATDEAIEKAVASAVCVRTSATEGMRCHALGLEPGASSCGCNVPEALAELVAIGASLGVNCTANINKHLAAAHSIGVPQEHLDEVFALVQKIRLRAISHGEAGFVGEGAAPTACGTPVPASSGCC
ncbi:MAG: carboxymuconolactone decarboxylase family protein [Rhodospirillaceae bacterium]|nr:carboxymuconolactone decarboxylase family protein [Rhodospirillales bacterium]